MKGFHFFIFSLFGFFLMGQHQDKVDFIRADVSIKPIPQEKRVEGLVVYEFNVLQDLDSVFLDAQNMNFEWVNLNGKRIAYQYDGKRITISKNIPKSDKNILSINYACVPEQTVYFSGWEDKIEGNEQIWTQGQGKYTSHWLPSLDDMEEKIEFDLSFDTSEIKDLEIIANGTIKEVVSNHNGSWIISLNMKKPMSSYLLAFAIGDYKKQELVSKSGIPIENYYYSMDSLKVEPTYRYTEQIFDFMEAEIGVPYPWQIYKQIPVHDFLYAGMENTTATIFSDQYVIDSTAFVDKNYVNVNAHELAHQWFGNLVTEKNGKHHWLHEGFATYYAYLAEQHIFGDDHLYWKLYASAQQLQAQSQKGEGESLLNPKASSLTFYEKGALALFMLKEQLGEMAFKKGIKNYLVKHQFKNVTVTDFLTEMELSSKMDLSDFKKQWLEHVDFPFESIKSMLKKYSPSLKILFEMENEFQQVKSDDLDYETYWNKTTSVHLKKQLIENHHQILPEVIIDRAFASDTVPIRQALANSLYGISGSRTSTTKLKTQYESLLLDESYITVETALLKLWVNFPEGRKQYLERTPSIMGLPNKNVRLLWLTLALATPDFNDDKKQGYLKELTSYTTSIYNAEIRSMAFQYLSEIDALDYHALTELVKATTHHSWQFRNFARRLLDTQLENEEQKNLILKIAQQLNESDLRYLQTKIKLP
ncbi:M1 family metallopeptidase [Maribacter sp. 2210JD10-5]|uniref:M1 family metallopeptidase n=1 Tax=Maribacter sp. 2210JD10-5 TaxID=3386272 RepID=UPI0039BC5BE5